MSNSDELFGEEDDDEVPPTVMQHSQTQPENTAFIKDIFGDSDDDGDFLKNSSDEEEKPKVFKKRLQSKSSKKARATDNDGLVDSDGEQETKKVKKRKQRDSKKDSDSSGKKKTKRLKQSTSTSTATNNTTAKGSEDSDAYDSEGDVVRTEDDDKFIDKDDDEEDVMREYDQDKQNFHDDERDTNFEKKGKSKGKSSSNSEAQQFKSKNSAAGEVLKALQKPKPVKLAASDMESYAEKLMMQMSTAVMRDDELFRKGEPAVEKLKLLPKVQKAVGLTDLHFTLLTGDILGALKDWIQPKEKFLPPLHLRTEVYKLLDKLPIETEHLRKSEIGPIITILRKHNEETEPNRNMLKNLIEKWSRFVFGKSASHKHFNPGNNRELREIALTQGLNSYSNVSNVDFHDALIGKNKDVGPQQPEGRARARTPYNNGHIFTIAPSTKTVEKRNSFENLSESRQKLLKAVKDKSAGKKVPHKAQSVSSNGKTLS